MATTAIAKKSTKSTKKVVKKAAEGAKKGLEKTGEFVSKNPKTALYIVGGAVGIYLLYKIFQGINKGSDMVGDVFNPDIDNNVDVGTIDTSGATISNQQAAIYAKQLLDAMNHKEPFWGTDEATILQVFKQLNSANFKKVFNAFGEKDYNGYNSPPTGFLANFDSYEPRNLVYWLNSELEPKDGEVYELVKTIVRGANFAFGK